jgi:hypothetical protein
MLTEVDNLKYSSILFLAYFSCFYVYIIISECLTLQ